MSLLISSFLCVAFRASICPHFFCPKKSGFRYPISWMTLQNFVICALLFTKSPVYSIVLNTSLCVSLKMQTHVFKLQPLKNRAVIPPTRSIPTNAPGVINLKVIKLFSLNHSDHRSSLFLLTLLQPSYNDQSSIPITLSIWLDIFLALEMDAMHKVTENLYSNVLNREHFRLFFLLNDPLILAQQTLLTEIVGAQAKTPQSRT